VTSPKYCYKKISNFGPTQSKFLAIPVVFKKSDLGLEKLVLMVLKKIGGLVT